MGLSEAFDMDWQVLHAICHRPEYRIGEDSHDADRGQAGRQREGPRSRPIGDSKRLPSLVEMERSPDRHRAGRGLAAGEG